MSVVLSPVLIVGFHNDMQKEIAMTSKTFIASVLSLALVVTGFSAPRARAMDEDAIAAILFGVTALAIIGAVVSEEKTSPRRPVSKPVTPKKIKKRQSWLPQHCSSTFPNRHGRVVQGYGARCLEQTQYPTNRLPQNCKTRIKNHNKSRAVFRTNCLHRNGYKVTWR